MRLQMQASEMRFLLKIKVVTTFVKYRNSAIRESLDIESLLFRIRRSQLGWFGHRSKIPQKRLHKESEWEEASWTIKNKMA